MSYQVLARKWRPKTFQDMVGQEHVLQALVHALDHNRLHHAYLFTGTRGVGKTTIGRLLARCLNCETGVTANPCGECTSCREVLENRFVDLIEIDAASRTGVDDMRELTDNVQYAPTRGRFKVYLIDEVHMLTNQSFNAFLKTLEEPPEHVKFLLATTDPQKLPVTVLSRCLQFNLKRMTPEHIVGHLKFILGEEQIPFEETALWQLARAADGSMRDALSLTDQAIAFGNQKLAASDVSSMLGTIDQRDIETLVDALVRADGPGLLAEIERITGFAPDYNAILTDLLSLFHRITTEQVVPGSVDNAMGDAARVQELARQLSAEDAQIFYQSALIGRKDLAITPDARMGFEMTLLRMLAFRPGADRKTPPVSPARPREEGAGRAATDAEGRETPDEPAPAAAPEPVDPAPPVADAGPAAPADTESSGPSAPDPLPETAPAPPWMDPEEAALLAYADQAADHYQEEAGEKDVAFDSGLTAELEQRRAEDQVSPDRTPAPSRVSQMMAAPAARPEPETEQSTAVRPEVKTDDTPAPDLEDFVWSRDFRKLGIVGMPGNLASQAACERKDERFILTLEEGHYRLLNDRHQQRILERLQLCFGPGTRLEVKAGSAGEDTPVAHEARIRAERQAQAEQAIEADPIVKALVERFEGKVIKETIRPVE